VYSKKILCDMISFSNLAGKLHDIDSIECSFAIAISFLPIIINTIPLACCHVKTSDDQGELVAW